MDRQPMTGCAEPKAQAGIAGVRWITRRGVVAIVAMMFLVLFVTLSVAMAVASKGNLRTAETHIQVLRATAAAETGLEIGVARLRAAAGRFVVARSTMDGAFVQRLWGGEIDSGDGRVVRLDPVGYSESVLPAGIAQALRNNFAADSNTLVFGSSVSTPSISGSPAGVDSSVFGNANWLFTPITAFDAAASDSSAHPAAYQITYAPLANGTDIRVVVTGYAGVNATGGTYASGSLGLDNPVTRIVQRDVRLTKRHRHAIVSPTRVLVGKNVSITGSIGAAYTAVDKPNGDPLQIKSDFYGLSADLDRKLDDFFSRVRQHDVDGDQRLRVNHAGESAGLPPASGDYNGDGTPGNAFADGTGDGYVDDFDIFLKHYDGNNDGKIVLSAALTVGTPNEGKAAEFTDDDDLARLIDGNNPDRNNNKVYGWQDTDRNGKWDSGENLNDYDAITTTYPDRVLGWRDGAIDRKDAYAKVKGQLLFRAGRSAWEAARGGTYQRVTEGSVNPGRGTSPTAFNADNGQVPDLDVADVANAVDTLAKLADGKSLDDQAAIQLGVASSELETYTEAKTDATKPRYFRATMNNAAAKALTGQNLYEKAPFNSPSFTDWYYRPRYENMVFKNVQIPAGNNGLFVNCTFVGVTYVRTNTQNTHTNWSIYGKMVWDNTLGRPVLATQALDKSDFVRYSTGLVPDGPINYSDLPDPPVIDGVTRTGAARNSKLYSNNLRLHNCLFVGSIVSDTPQVFNPVRNKIQFTGATRFAKQHPTSPEDVALNPDSADVPDIQKSSMMLPQYSVEIGQFNSPTDTYTGGPTPQSVALSGTIVAGVLDARGNTDIQGTLLMTFKPTLGQAPLEYNGTPVGNPAKFNVSLGYFGPSDGDAESYDPATLPTVGGQKIVGYDTDGDGLADVKYDMAQPIGSTAIPFYGYGRLNVVWNPALPMPDGIMLPVSVVLVENSYREGRPW